MSPAFVYTAHKHTSYMHVAGVNLCLLGIRMLQYKGRHETCCSEVSVCCMSEDMHREREREREN